MDGRRKKKLLKTEFCSRFFLLHPQASSSSNVFHHPLTYIRNLFFLSVLVFWHKDPFSFSISACIFQPLCTVSDVIFTDVSSQPIQKSLKKVNKENKTGKEIAIIHVNFWTCMKQTKMLPSISSHMYLGHCESHADFYFGGKTILFSVNSV